MSTWQAYLADMLFSFRRQKELAEQAFRQLDDDAFFHKPGEHSNSLAIMIKHVAGNLRSRWTDFLTADGEKEWRDRDAEFVIGPEDTRTRLLEAWEAGWAALFASLGDLKEEDLLKKVKIRGEQHTVLQALDRSLTHAAYHAGQMVYVARLLKTDGWQWITIPPGGSKAFDERAKKYLK